MKKKIRYILLITFIFLVIFYLFLVWERYQFNDRIYNNTDSLDKVSDYVIVFGAGLRAGNKPSDILADRITTAVNLYKAGKGNKIVMSGDSVDDNHDEVEAMSTYAEALGVRKEDILKDEKGYDTYSTCWRAKNVFGISKATLVTQEYHMNRALYICNSVGINSYGVTSDLNIYKDIKKFKIRESFAFLKSFFEVLFKYEEKEN